ncbi:hypothetical protein MMC28_000075 [Mycoblastus sanguinarius]|nr:hypothetical protein [Mycoblastus sanguinarius]
MSTQYDEIGTSYEEMRKLPAAILQDANVEAAVAPYIKGAKVLDLACGTGYYSRKFLNWGAEKVVGVDISKAMIEGAKAASSSNELSFQVGDCSKPVQFEGGPFDLVFGAWLLNYASSGKDMANMFHTVALNLKNGGHFIGITQHPTQDPREHTEAALAARPLQYGGVLVTPIRDVEDGVATHLVAITKSGKVEFDAYHLRKGVFEKFAREGGLKGDLSWRPVIIPDGYGGSLGAMGDEAWATYFTVPHFSVLIVTKD